MTGVVRYWWYRFTWPSEEWVIVREYEGMIRFFNGHEEPKSTLKGDLVSVEDLDRKAHRR